MNKKVTRTLIIIYIITMAVTIASVTYAYFTDILVSNVSPEVEIKSATTEFIVFDVGKEINLIADESNMKLGLNSIQDDTIASASLRLSEGQGPVTHTYNIYIEIEENDFTYSTPEKKPEIILTLMGPNGDILEAPGLEYVEVKDNIGKWVLGFDVTTKVGKYYILKEYPITADSLEEVVHNWKIRLTFVNLSDNQNGNTARQLKGQIKIEKAD